VQHPKTAFGICRGSIEHHIKAASTVQAAHAISGVKQLEAALQVQGVQLCSNLCRPKRLTSGI
jgi:hypothetical protein